jgi:hypothetical protein
MGVGDPVGRVTRSAVNYVSYLSRENNWNRKLHHQEHKKSLDTPSGPTSRPPRMGYTALKVSDIGTPTDVYSVVILHIFHHLSVLPLERA